MKRRNNASYIVKDFYDDPDKVREYALKCDYYSPYGKNEDGTPISWQNGITGEWFSSDSEQRYITDESIFKLEKIIGAKIDMDHFYNNSKTYSPDDNGTRWNAGFQIKMNTEGELGAKGIHCHINDGWNHSGYRNGWAAVVFLTPDHMSYENNGFDIWTHRYGLNWKNVSERRDGLKWISDHVACPKWKINEPAPVVSMNEEWDMFARIQYKYNTLVLHPAEEYHAGSNGWGDSIQTGRLLQTFFFKERD